MAVCVSKEGWGKIFISADSHRQSTFIHCAEKAAAMRNFQCLYPPSRSGGPIHKTLLDKTLGWLDQSIFVVMEVTPYKHGRLWFTNTGVLIEFGIVAGTNKLNWLSLFAEENCPVDKIHPFVRSKEIIRYSPRHPRVLTRLIKEEIDRYIADRLHRPRSPKPFA